MNNQQTLIFTIVNKPYPQDVEYIAIFSGGQEGGIKGYPQAIPGSNSGWRQRLYDHAGNDEWTSGPGTMERKSPPILFHEAGQYWGNVYKGKYPDPKHVGGSPANWYGFDPKKTLIISIADAAFMYPGNWLNSAETVINFFIAIGDIFGNVNYKHAANSQKENNQMLAGWADWLGYQVDWNNIKGFVGQGMSRGGCFVTRLADLLFTTKSELVRNNAKLFLETFDPVCHEKEWSKDVQTTNGLGMWEDKVEPHYQGTVGHPYQSDRKWQCKTIHTDNLFVGVAKQNIAWLNVIGGENILEDQLGGDVFPGDVHAFCDVYTDGSKQNLVIDHAGNRYTFGDMTAFDPMSAAPGTPEEWKKGNFNNPMPDNCNYWYKQYFVPWKHMVIGGAYTPLNSRHPVTGAAPPCDGMAYCGGYVGGSSNLNVCKPHFRADLDLIYKGFRHQSVHSQCMLKAPAPTQGGPKTLTKDEYFAQEGDVFEGYDPAFIKEFSEAQEQFWSESADKRWEVAPAPALTEFLGLKYYGPEIPAGSSSSGSGDY